MSSSSIVIAPPLLSVTTSHVYARLADDSLLVVSLPELQHEDGGNALRLHYDGPGEIVAAGHLEDGSPGVVVQHAHDLTLVAWAEGRPVVRGIGSSDEPLGPPPEDGRLFALVSDGDRVFFVDRREYLCEFRPGERAQVFGGCSAIAYAAGTLFFVDHDEELQAVRKGELLAIRKAPGDFELLAPTLQGGIAALFRAGIHWMAVSIDPQTLDQWVQAAQGRSGPVAALDSHGLIEAHYPHVVGVLDHIERPALPGAPRVRGVGPGPALLLLVDEGRKLRVVASYIDPGFSVDLPARAVHVVFDPRTSVAACVTDTAELILVGLSERALRSRFTGTGRAAV
jgi:hypothetical protein